MVKVLGLDEIKRTPYIQSSFPPPQYLHSHDFVEISFCVTGRSINTINGNAIPFQNGSCVIIRPNDVHSVTEYNEKTYEHVDIYITKEKFKNLCDSCADGLYQEIMDETSPLYLTFNNETFSFIFNRSLMLKEMLINQTELFEAVHSSMVTLILAEWINYKANMQVYKPEWLKSLLPKFNNVNFVQKNITQIAQETGFSLPYFSTQFKKYMGVSAIEYLTKKRVDLSKKLLMSDTGLRILDISGMLGFENPSTFSKHFLQEYKITPKQFRMEYLKSVQP